MDRSLMSTHTATKKAGECSMDTPHTLGKKQISKCGSHIAPLRTEFFGGLWDEYLRFLRTSDCPFTYLLWEFHNMSEVLKVGQKETAYPNRGNYGNLMCAATWDSDANEEVGVQWIRKIGIIVREELERTKAQWGENLGEGSKTTVGE